MKRVAVAVGAGFVLSALLAPLAAQQSGVQGVVTDSTSGAVLAEVLIRPSDAERGILTGPEGRFSLPSAMIEAGELTFSRIGYTSRSIPTTWLVAQEGVVEIRLLSAAVSIAGIAVDVRAAQDRARIQAPETSTLLDVALIRASQAQTLGATIEEVPGVSIIQYGPAIAKPVIRGLHSQRVIVANAGVRQEGQQWGGEHAPEIDVFAADQIEVIRGPGSVRFGSDAMGGVVRIEPAPIAQNEEWSGDLALNAFANNLQGAASIMLERGGLDLPVLGSTGVRFRATGRKAGDATAPGFNLGNTGFDELSLSGGLGWVGEGRRTELTFSRYDTNLGLFAGAHVGNFDDLLRAIERGPAATEFGYAIDNPRQSVTHDKVQLRHEVFLASGAEIEASYAFQLNRRREFDNHGPLARRDVPAFGLDLYTHSLESSVGLPLAGGTSRFGISGMRQGNISVGKGFLIPQYRLYTGGAFATHDQTWGPLTVTAGVRADYRWQRIFPPPDQALDFQQQTESWADVSGGLGANWEWADGWFLGAHLGRAWRAPNVNERYSLGVHHGTAQYEIGDATLGKESTLGLDVTLRGSSDAGSLQVNLYRNAIDNFVFLEPRDPVLTIRGAFPAFNYRQADARMTGIELDAERAVGAGLRLFARGSMVRGDNLVSGEPLFDMPADRLRLGVGWSPFDGGGLSVEASTLLVREQDQVPSETIYGLPTDGYQLVDLGLEWNALRLLGTTVDLSVDVQNLLDQSYRDYLSRYRLFVDDPGRDIVVRVQVPLGG